MRQNTSRGKVIVKLRLVNNGEWFNYERELSRRKPHQAEVEALVDTGATRLYLKPSVIRALASPLASLAQHYTSG